MNIKPFHILAAMVAAAVLLWASLVFIGKADAAGLVDFLKSALAIGGAALLALIDPKQPQPPTAEAADPKP